MENKNKFISMSYRLYVDGEEGKELMEETQEGKPFQMITGFGVALDAFEKKIADIEKGQDFSFSLEKEEAYGDYVEESHWRKRRPMATMLRSVYWTWTVKCSASMVVLTTNTST